jgi:aspartyl-tRNA(Asn)/glutamyl-tRNA(Gln) amidotransferase subunit A
MFTTSSSHFLKNFYSGRNASVVCFLENKQKFVAGKTVLDEFACGGTGLNAVTGKIYNPLDSSRITGGSSSGSA